jgi:hypothetical protein
MYCFFGIFYCDLRLLLNCRPFGFNFENIKQQEKER